jgi:D-alanyl-D-alanine dipeptidase
MGTDFDNFTDTAHHSFKFLSQEILQNRELLKTLMEKNGFTAYNEEWWHYTFKSDVAFEVLNILFGKLKNRK